jgi:hypothetical protein
MFFVLTLKGERMFIKNVRFSQTQIHLLPLDAEEIAINVVDLTPDEVEELHSGVQELMASHQARINKLHKAAVKLAEVIEAHSDCGLPMAVVTR